MWVDVAACPMPVVTDAKSKSGTRGGWSGPEEAGALKWLPGRPRTERTGLGEFWTRWVGRPGRKVLLPDAHGASAYGGSCRGLTGPLLDALMHDARCTGGREGVRARPGVECYIRSWSASLESSRLTGLERPTSTDGVGSRRRLLGTPSRERDPVDMA